MTMNEAIKTHMARVDAGDMDFHRRVGARQEAILGRMAPKARDLDEAFRMAVEIEAAIAAPPVTDAMNALRAEVRRIRRATA